MANEERVDSRLLAALTDAHERARTRRQALDSGHVFLEMLRDELAGVADVLSTLGVDLEALQNATEAALPNVHNHPAVQAAETAVAPEVSRSFDRADQMRRRFSETTINAAHLFLGLLAEPDGSVAQILVRSGVDPEAVRVAVQAHLLAGHRDIWAEGQLSVPPASKTPELDKYSRDLSWAVHRGEMAPVIGRDSEVRQMREVLSRRTKNNVALIGDSGVGKTAIATAFARELLSHPQPAQLQGKRVVALDLAAIVAGTTLRGQFEERLQKVISEAVKSKQVILFIDEMHTLVGAGSGEGSLDAANILKPALASGELLTIGATTWEEYKKRIETDAALESRYQPLKVAEPDLDQTIAILRGLRSTDEKWHKVQITDAALRAAAELSNRYVADRHQPRKAVDAIDQAAARRHLALYDRPAELDQLQMRLIRAEQLAASTPFDNDRLMGLRMRALQRARLAYTNREEQWRQAIDTTIPIVGEDDVASVIADWTGIPVARMRESERVKLLRLEETFDRRVVGQDDAKKAIASAIRRARVDLKMNRGPIGSFVLLGPTGVGKTELARTLAEVLFDSEDALIRIDMSEYQEKQSISRLVGAPPGYIGYDEGGQLTEAVRRRPYSVVLFDEIEKAHPDVFKTLLQLLEDGRLTDGQGRTVSFKNTVIIMTSNNGSLDLQKMEQEKQRAATHDGVGFAASAAPSLPVLSDEEMATALMEKYDEALPPEFRNRITEVCVCSRLNRDDIIAILELKREAMVRNIEQSKGVRLRFTDAARAALVERVFETALRQLAQSLSKNGKMLRRLPEARELIYSPMGARPLDREIDTTVLDPLAVMILEKGIKPGTEVVVDAGPGNEITLEPVRRRRVRRSETRPSRTPSVCVRQAPVNSGAAAPAVPDSQGLSR